MNLCLIGGKATAKLSDIITASFDDITIVTYVDVNIFMREAALRALDIHRIVLLQDGIDDVDDEKVYEFSNFLMKFYPAVRLITLNKDIEVAKFMGDVTLTPYAVHFCTDRMKSKMLIDIVAQDVEKLQKQYTSMVYVREAKGYSEVIEEDIGEEIVEESLEEEAMVGKVQKGQRKTKRGFFSKVFGQGPKNQKGLYKEEGTKAIGTVGDEVEEEELEEVVVEQPEESEVDLNYTIFDKEENDVGQGYIPEDEEDGEEYEDEEEEYAGGEDGEEYEDEEEEYEGEEEEYEGEEEEYEGEEEEYEGEEEEYEGEEEEYEGEEEEYEGEEEEYEGEEEEYEGEEEEYEGEEEEYEEEEYEGEEEDEVRESRDILAELKEELGGLALRELKEETEEEIDIRTGEVVGGEVLEGLEDLEEQYNDRNKRVEYIEKVVTVEKQESRRNRKGVRIILVTGDRRVGVTKLSMNLAGIFAKQEKTLLVDLDIKRKGVLGYMGVEELIQEGEHKQNGLKYIKGSRMLNSVTFLYRKGGFFTLTSMYGEDIEDEQFGNIQQVLNGQSEFKTIVIDCPMENLHKLGDIYYTSNILMCMEDDYVGILNGLMTVREQIQDRYMLPFYNNTSYVIGRGGDKERFRGYMTELVEMFGLDETDYNWGELDIVGTLKDTRGVAKHLAY